MEFPIIVLSYGDFSDTKKLFFYDDDNGISLFPIFTDPTDAVIFCNAIQKMMQESDDERIVRVQVCDNPKFAKDMLETVSAIIPELFTVIFDPTPPGGEKLLGRNRRRTIEDVVYELSE